jgi:PAS domain S-box-containing protein
MTPKAAHEEQMRLLEAAVANIHDIVLITEAAPIDDPGPRIVFVNKAFERRTGFAAAEVLGRSPRLLQGPATQRAELDRIRAALERWQPVRAELINYTKAGEMLWLEIDIVPLADETGRVTHWVSVERDVTEQKRSREQHGRLAARLSAVLESMSDAFCLLDDEWRFVYLNAEAERVLLRKREDLLGRSVWDEFPESRGTEVDEAYRRAIRERKPEHLEFFYPPLGHWFGINAYPTSEGLAVYFQVISERKEVESQLKESEERFRIVAQATADVVWDWNLVEDTIWWNDGMRKLFGYDVGEQPAAASTWTDYIHAEDKERVLAGVDATITGAGTQWFDEYRFLRADGSIAQVTDRGFVIRDAAGKAVRMIGSMVDVTERRRLETQLGQAQRLDAMGHLTGGVAHDFNNLLTVILGNAETLAERLAADPGLRETAEMTKTAAKRGAELTNRLLAFARRQALDPKAVDVNALLADMDSLLRRTLGEHVEIEIVKEAGLWEALVDASQLESAVLNLCINARDAMPQGGRLIIETKNTHLDPEYAAVNTEVSPGPYVMVTVSDTGTGMTQDIVARAFDPFFTTKDVGKGSGLGLSMIYGFVKQSRGHVRIYSEPGHGTAVSLYLPKAEGEAIDWASQTITRNVMRGTEKILVVEDDDLVRTHVAAQLERLGYRVVSVSNGPEALDRLRKAEDFDLLFTDVVMPGGMGGRQLADEALKLRPGLPVLFTSGYTENAIVHHGRLDPGVHLLSKPYRRQELAAKVRFVLDAGQFDAG